MTMKYKVIKTWPSGPKVGTIFTKQVGMSVQIYCGEGSRAILVKEVESLPEFFAPHVFITLDNKDIFVGDTFYFIDSTNTCWLGGTATIHCSIRNFSGKVFSTKEAAQQYINELNKPKFEKGEWLYFNNEEFYGIFRFESCNEYGLFRSDEAYWFSKKDTAYYRTDSYYTSGSFDKHWNIEKASNYQIETALTRVAISKGFKEGIKYRNAAQNGLTIFDKDSKFFYNSIDGLGVLYSGWVYYQGKWAEIVEVPETKELTITLDGDVVNTSHWGNNVKITYK